jgi:hypothetical protein
VSLNTTTPGRLATAVGEVVDDASGEVEREIAGPIAIVIVRGLVSSTLLNLRVLPTLALRHGRFERREETA